MGVDFEHYHDAGIDLRFIQDYELAVFVNNEGKTRTICFSDNFFSIGDLIDAYRELEGDEEGNFIKWLIATGAPEDEIKEYLEENQ